MEWLIYAVLTSAIPSEGLPPFQQYIKCRLYTVGNFYENKTGINIKAYCEYQYYNATKKHEKVCWKGFPYNE